MKTLGSREITPPEKKPYNIANTIKPAGELIPNQAKIMTPVAKENGIIILNGPILSATKLGSMRPKIDAAFKIESFT